MEETAKSGSGNTYVGPIRHIGASGHSSPASAMLEIVLKCDGKDRLLVVVATAAPQVFSTFAAMALHSYVSGENVRVTTYQLDDGQDAIASMTLIKVNPTA